MECVIVLESGETAARVGLQRKSEARRIAGSSGLRSLHFCRVPHMLGLPVPGVCVGRGCRKVAHGGLEVLVF